MNDQKLNPSPDAPSDGVKRLLEAVNGEGAPASRELLPLLYDELKSVVAEHSSHGGGRTLHPKTLVNEAWLRLAKEEADLCNDRARFFYAAAQAIRRILVDRARANRGVKSELMNVLEFDVTGMTANERVLLVDRAMDRMETEDPESARVIALTFFGGLTYKEIAVLDHQAESRAEQAWAYAKARLFHLIRKENAP
jgi:RNA polymerase sigma factor (TIGR02999 family)